MNQIEIRDVYQFFGIILFFESDKKVHGIFLKNFMQEKRP
jgi:hypothetical protein